MKNTLLSRAGLGVLVLALLGLLSASVLSDTVFFAGTPPTVAQSPLYMKDAAPPLNMLVLGKDHKNYYEAYNDASDLNGDGSLDTGYKPATIDYYGYFNSFACYTWQTNKFVPVTASPNKQCSGQWSGDFLNYLTTSRMDALRGVLYGGWRHVDTATETVLQGAFFPQDAHSWGKEYQSTARDGYDIARYAPLSQPTAGNYHLFAVTTVADNTAPLFRVLRDAPYRIWNWLSIEGPVAGNKCFSASNTRVDCASGSGPLPFPGHPGTRAAFNLMEANYALPANLYGTSALTSIDCASNCNLQGADDEYLTILTGTIDINNGRGGNYQFRVDGDDVIDFVLYENGNEIATAGCYTTAGRGFGACAGAEQTALVTLDAGRTYTFRMRQEDGTGGDGYQLQWRRSDTGNQFAFRTLLQDGSDPGANGNGGIEGSVSASFYDLTPSVGGSSRTDYAVRVQVCPATAALREGTCKAYPNGNYKPTGILHDYGESQKMYFGLITGSQNNNLEGGVLRKNVSNFANEIDVTTGVFNSTNGIVGTIDRLRMIGGSYNGGTTNNLASDSNWNWAGGYGNCPSIGDRAIDNGECRMWGNPVGEMLFESLRYFAGAGGATPRFATGGASQGTAEETAMGLPTSVAWQNPYAASPGGGYPACAKPNQTVISDINVSYDGDLPGSQFAGALTTAGTMPTAISGFNAGNEGQQIWNSEFGPGARNVFVGESGGVTDGAPTLKVATSFGNIRGLAPEEPTKGGSFYSASVARFGRNNDLSAATGIQNLSTYSVALASPLPKIEFATSGGRIVTLLPFAKTVSGTFGGGTRKPTNTIVDFYVEEIVNLPGQPFVAARNGGRPYAVFRINYEDVEQGNDHDMDAIVRYEVSELANSKVEVTLTSEYAAGSANQNIGYTISGTTRDGIYLEVRDRDGPGTPYFLNTPEGADAGDCAAGVGTPPCNQPLPLVHTRVFSPRTQTPGDILVLRDPLWYAAKFGAPDLARWDENADGEPDNYFLVTNPLNLRAQLSRAFEDIANRSVDVGNATINGSRVGNSSFTLQPTFRRERNGKDWTGDISAIAVASDGTLGSVLWSAQAKLPPNAGSAAGRNIKVMTSPGAGTASSKTAADFQAASLGLTNDDQLSALGINPTSVATKYGATYNATAFVSYLRGDKTREAGAGGVGNTLRSRASVLGDIVNSEPVVASPKANFGYAAYPAAMFSNYGGVGGYLTTKATRKTVVYVGANDGMLHGFDASTSPCAAPNASMACPTIGAGDELFGFIPNDAVNKLGLLPLPDSEYQHRYYVDGQVTVGDAKDGGSWKTLLAATMGAGGRSIFVLDVSQPDAFNATHVLWERNSKVDLDLGNMYGKPLLVPLENNRWGVLIGNGYGGNSSDPSLYVLDAFTGAVIRKITANDGNPGSATLSPIANFICSILPAGDFCARKTDPFNGLGQITAIDRDGNGKADTVYGGDLQGNMWKFDLKATTESTWAVAFGGLPLLTAEVGGERQPITGGIRVSAGPGEGVMVYFGTGRYLVDGDNNVPATPTLQSLYGVWDNTRRDGTGGTSAVSRTSAPAGTGLIQQTITLQTTAGGFTTRDLSQNLVPYYGTSARRGWYLDLQVTGSPTVGERFIAVPRIQSGKVFFTTYTPQNDSCAPGGTNFIYVLDLLSGAGSLANVQVLPSQTPACTNGTCGGVAIRGPDGTTQPPVTGTGVVAINPIVPVSGPGTCTPGAAGCPTFEQCQVVIYPGAFVLPRPCGRQSWRQLK